MSMTLHEWKKTLDDPMRAGIVETLFNEERLLAYIPFETISGLAYAYNLETELPGIAFRRLNAAYAESVGVIQREVETLKPFGGDSDTDRALIEAYGQARRSSTDQSKAKAAAAHYVQWFLYGNSPAGRSGATFTDVDGFDGLQARLTGAQVIDGGGSSGSDGSSVFAIRFGDPYVTGIQTPSGVMVEDLGQLQTKPSFRTRIEHIAGVAVKHGRSACWIKDLTAATTMLTVALMDQMVDQVVGSPDLIVMSKRSRRQLKADCLTKGIMLASTLDALGKPVSAWDTIPIITSDAVIDTETVS
jgi:hypothetical protein